MSTRLSEADMTPPHIAPIPHSVDRPLWSVMIPTFNCAKYLRQTLESVLTQDPGPEHMQIEVVDDCSTLDDPESVVQEMGKGRVNFYRKQKNEGAIANFNTCIERSCGQLVHILHGDDWVEAEFYNQVKNAFDMHDDLGICITRVLIVEESGALDSLSPRIPEMETPVNQANFMYYDNPVRTPGVVIHRNQYESRGGFLPSLIHTADWEMWVRIIRSSKGLFLNKPMASYRYFPGNDTGRLAKSGENLKDYLRLAEVLLRYDDGYEFQRFEFNVMQSAKHQSLRFQELDDHNAFVANSLLYHELLRNQPFKIKALERFRDLRASLKAKAALEFL